MKNWFDEKTGQVKPESFTAFDIAISSRYGKAYEIIEMLNFSQQISRKNMAHYVKSIFYDSKGCICNFELESTVINGGQISSQLLDIARNTISQFMWFDRVEVGLEPDEEG
ncbi:hypothetical protein DESUT3_21250 [Desulfuromonas versatilis]|uniref:Uncharacterized protein n=1 Tax=Desulfuromonas versatilis TaxID=2802975 RepID=A0ABN6DY55_9BACT|nr:hypothetical protein [Desulfuromonas versatilis]BCR05056.1 hypothetical protein DESUT3_21250 [Desulfuromonas versatilis]